MPHTHTLPAAKVVGHDFLGNHIGELLFRQPIKKQAAPTPAPAPPPSRPKKASSNGSTVCSTDTRRPSRPRTVVEANSMTPSLSSTSANSPKNALDSVLSVGAIPPSGLSSDPVASLEHNSQSPASEPTSVGSRSGDDESELTLLHLDQLSLSRKRNASEGASDSPVSFVTSFGAKPRGSGSRRAPSEPGSSSYFGFSSNASSRMSSASVSPMERSANISWGLPFCEQSESFARAVEHHTYLNRNMSQESQSLAAASSSQPHRSSESPRVHQGRGATPLSLTGDVATAAKSQSFSGASQPVRQRLARAATESTLDPIAQLQDTLRSPGASSRVSTTGLSHSNSLRESTPGRHGHRRKPSLVPKGDDQRTFCFVETPTSEAKFDLSLVEESGLDSVASTSAPTHAAVQSPCSASEQANTHVSTDSRMSRDDTTEAVAPSTRRPKAVSFTLTSEASQGRKASQSDASRALQSVLSDQYTPSRPLVPAKPLPPVGQNVASRPVRRLRIQPNVQSRPSLLEKTIEELGRSSRPAEAPIDNARSSESKPAAETPGANERPSASSATTNPVGEKYDRVAFGMGQRTFRIQSTIADDCGFPFDDSSPDERAKPRQPATPPASHARTSDWARAQNRLAASPSAEEQARTCPQPGAGHLDMHASCPSLSGFDIAGEAQRHQPSGLQRHHTASHSSSSTESPSLLDNRELLSPPETAISTPELESPPERALNAGDPLKSVRRASPLAI